MPKFMTFDTLIMAVVTLNLKNQILNLKYTYRSVDARGFSCKYKRSVSIVSTNYPVRSDCLSLYYSIPPQRHYTLSAL